MKTLKAFCVLLVAAVFAASCKKEGNNGASFDNRSTSAADYAASSLPVTAVSGDITSNTTWDAGHVWELSGVVTVRNGATLTIEPGTYIKSSVNTPGVQNGVLVIGKDGTVNAVGTSSSPIVFTSRYLLDGNASTTGKPGDFGGVIILGNAKINAPGGSKLIEGLANDPKYYYGGTNDADNRGNLKYVRIEYAGFQLATDVEVNGLTLGGVGSGTQIDHVQVSYGLDDSFEFFGGKVSPRYLVALAADDDQYDFDNGFTGSIQYAIAVADVNSTHSTSGGNSDSNGIESDNNAPAEDATFSLLPKTHPALSNFTIVGTNMASSAYRYGARNRRGTEITMTNSIITGYPLGMVFDADASATPSTLTNNSFHGFTAAISVSTGTYSGSANITATGSPANAFGMTQPWFNSPGSPSTLNFFAAGTKGAVTTTSGNWTSGWTKFVY